MGTPKGAHGHRPKRHPRFNRSSRSQRLRRLREKEALLKLHDEQQVIDKSQTQTLKTSKESYKLSGFSSCIPDVSSLPGTKTGILNPSKQNLKKHLDTANKCISRPYPIRDSKAELFRPAKQKALVNLLSGQIINESLLNCSKQAESKASLPIKNKEILNSSEGNSNLLEYSPNTRVVNSVPVTIVEILGSSQQSLQTCSTPDVCKNESSGLTNRCKQRPNPRSKTSKSQRLCRAKNKQDLRKLCGAQNIKESFQECVEEVASRDSVSTCSKEILNTSKKIKRYSNFSQNVSVIKDSLPVIKTEIPDPPEENNTVIFEDYPQSATTMGYMPVLKMENLDPFQEDQKTLLPNIKIKETQRNRTINETSIAYPTSNMTNNNSIKNSKHVIETCSEVYSFPVKNKCPSADSYKKSASSKKKKIGLTATVSHNKVNTNNVNSICNCVKKVAAMKQLCEGYLKSVHQDDANQLCLCKVKNNTLLESSVPHEEAMKEFYLKHPDFGKINHKIKTSLKV